jgi:hypothetical protein
MFLSYWLPILPAPPVSTRISTWPDQPQPNFGFNQHVSIETFLLICNKHMQYMAHRNRTHDSHTVELTLRGDLKYVRRDGGRLLYACSTAVPGGVTADDDVACVPTCVDGARDNRRDQGELDGRGVDDADGVTGAGALQHAKERPAWAYAVKSALRAAPEEAPGLRCGGRAAIVRRRESVSSRRRPALPLPGRRVGPLWSSTA